jgi:hypothetical protein
MMAAVCEDSARKQQVASTAKIVREERTIFFARNDKKSRKGAAL